MTLEMNQCWQKAVSEYGGDGDGVLRKYHQLMKENGHLVPRPSPIEALPCGWQPGPPSYSLADGLLCGEETTGFDRHPETWDAQTEESFQRWVDRHE